jgi:hypothetical protein
VENRLIFDTHPSENIFEEYAFNRLSESDCAEFEEHLLVCARCQHNLAETDQYIQLMKRGTVEWRNLSSATVTAAKAPRMSTVRAPIAAILTALALIAALAIAIPHYSRRATGHASPTELVAFRGGAGPAMAKARAGGPITVMIDTADLDNPRHLRIQVVDANGKQIWTGAAAEPVTGTRISARIDTRLRAGIYWIRLYSPAGGVLREFGLHAE